MFEPMIGESAQTANAGREPAIRARRVRPLGRDLAIRQRMVGRWMDSHRDSSSDVTQASTSGVHGATALPAVLHKRGDSSKELHRTAELPLEELRRPLPSGKRRAPPTRSGRRRSSDYAD